jgi:hypothetical protein
MVEKKGRSLSPKRAIAFSQKGDRFLLKRLFSFGFDRTFCAVCNIFLGGLPCPVQKKAYHKQASAGFTFLYKTGDRPEATKVGTGAQISQKPG